MTRQDKKNQRAANHQLAQQRKGSTRFHRVNQLDTMGRDNTNKRGPEVGNTNSHIQRVNHRHAVWCKENGYPFKQSNILSDADYLALCDIQPEPVEVTSKQKQSAEWYRQHSHLL